MLRKCFLIVIDERNHPTMPQNRKNLSNYQQVYAIKLNLIEETFKKLETYNQDQNTKKQSPIINKYSMTESIIKKNYPKEEKSIYR